MQSSAEKNVDDDSAISYDHDSIEDGASESKSTISTTDNNSIVNNHTFETKSPDTEDVGLCIELSNPNEYTTQEPDIHDVKKTLVATLLYHIISTSTAVREKSTGLHSRQAPPRFPLSECIWTFSGSFTIIFVLGFLSTNIPLWNDNGHAFPLGKLFLSYTDRFEK